MLDILSNIADTLTALIDFIVKLVQDLIFVVETLATALLSIPHYIGWLPTSVISLVTVIFTVVVIYKILGREG